MNKIDFVAFTGIQPSDLMSGKKKGGGEKRGREEEKEKGQRDIHTNMHTKKVA